MNTVDEQFIESFRDAQEEASGIETAHGFNEGEYNIGLKIALVHGELSEALEAERKNITVSQHIPEFNGLEEEFADAIIRIMGIAEARKLRLAEAIVAKQEFNRNRPYKHGGKKF